jgi:hypothetical protein
VARDEARHATARPSRSLRRTSPTSSRTSKSAGASGAPASAEQVGAIAAALTSVDEAWLRERYEGLEFPDYDGVRCEYTWANFRGLLKFFQAAADAGRAVIFTVDQ